MADKETSSAGVTSHFGITLSHFVAEVGLLLYSSFMVIVRNFVCGCKSEVLCSLLAPVLKIMCQANIRRSQVGQKEWAKRQFTGLCVFLAEKRTQCQIVVSIGLAAAITESPKQHVYRVTFNSDGVIGSSLLKRFKSLFEGRKA